MVTDGKKESTKTTKNWNNPVKSITTSYVFSQIFPQFPA